MRSFISSLSSLETAIRKYRVFKDEQSRRLVKLAFRRTLILSTSDLPIEVKVDGLKEYLDERNPDSLDKLKIALRSVLDPKMLELQEFSDEGFIVLPVGDDFGVDEIPADGKDRENAVKVLKGDIEEYILDVLGKKATELRDIKFRGNPEHTDYKKRPRRERYESLKERSTKLAPVVDIIIKGISVE